jgi:hypothetical protein
LEIGGVGQVLSKSASTRWKRRKKIKKHLERIYICMYICIYQSGRNLTN